MSINKRDFAVPLLMLLCLGHFCVDFMLGIWPVYKTMVGLDLAVAGIIAACSVIFAEGLQAYFGSLSDRGYQRILLFVGITLAASATFFSYTGNYLLLMLLFLATCLGSAAFHPTAASILSSLTEKKSSTMMGLFTASGMIGLGVSQLVFSWTHATLAGHTPVLALGSLTVAIVMYLFMKGKTAAPSTGKKPHSLALYMRFLKDKGLRALYFSMIGNQIVLWSLVFLLPDFLKERDFAPWIVLGGGHLFLMIGATVGPPLLGFVADKISTRTVLIVSSILTPLFFYMLLLPLQITEGLLFSLLFLLGAVLGSVPPLVWALGARLVPEHRGVISAFLMGFVWIVSETLGLGLSGVLASLFSEAPAMSALACMGTVQLFCSLANMQIPNSTEEQAYQEFTV